MIASASLAGCAVGGDELGEAELALEDLEGGGDQIALEDAGEAPDPSDKGRACTQSEWNIAGQHADDNHTLPIPGSANTLDPRVTGCHVSNGYIVYTYAYP
ncbi:hypothetical protein [Polyangium aurulentum]|uniref:hypothetical protein n=1 Tax=Polyangium aurulentum TaxID=2567896 RepID=UPI0010ADADF5|nr:hypothetical protein [Polyangium aurulentum]UQA55610.1 hypothetical protein E8A73_030245 [Polyangium aurulentum]